MRRFLLLLVLTVVPSTLLAQPLDRDERWRERRAPSYATPSWSLFELTPFGGYRYGGTLRADGSNLFVFDTDIASAASLGLNFGIPLGDSPMKLELMVNRQNTYLSGGSGLFEPDVRLADFDITYYHGGLQIPIISPRSHTAVPFIVLSAGVANLSPDLDGVSSENRFSASAGLGIKVPLSRNIGLRAEARGYFTSLDDRGDDCFRCYDYGYGRDLYQGETNIGLVISF